MDKRMDKKKLSEFQGCLLSILGTLSLIVIIYFSAQSKGGTFLVAIFCGGGLAAAISSIHFYRSLSKVLERVIGRFASLDSADDRNELYATYIALDEPGIRSAMDDYLDSTADRSNGIEYLNNEDEDEGHTS